FLAGRSAYGQFRARLCFPGRLAIGRLWLGCGLILQRRKRPRVFARVWRRRARRAGRYGGARLGRFGRRTTITGKAHKITRAQKQKKRR
ncbi:MAG: hypothetical protein B7X53_18120, partial [Hyphomonas sp. 34-62-18]